MLVVGSCLLALVLSAVVWPAANIALSIAHEGAHALTASAMGGKVKSIKISKGGGVTGFTSAGPMGEFLTFLAGYLGPSVFGLMSAVLLAGDNVVAVLWVSLVLLFLALLRARNLLAGVGILITGGVFGVVLAYASPGAQLFFTHTWTWFLLFGGFIDVLVLQHLREKDVDTSSDAYHLRRLSLLPASLWSGFFWLATLAAIGYGAAILFGFIAVGVPQL